MSSLNQTYAEITLDLDALERRQTDPNNDPNFDFAMMTKGEAIALIQRLRKLERVNEAASLDAQLGWELSPTLAEALDAVEVTE